MKKLLSAVISTSMILSGITGMAANGEVSSTLTFYDASHTVSTSSNAAYASGSATIDATSGYDGSKYIMASYADSSCAKITGLEMSSFSFSGSNYQANIAEWKVEGSNALKEFYLNGTTLKPLASSKLTSINEGVSAYKVEGESFSSISSSTYYLINNTHWYGTIDFSNSEALQINNLAKVTYNITSVPAGTYSVKLYGGNVESDMQAALTVTINGNTYSVETPEIGGIGNYDYESVNISDALAMTGNDTITITCDNSKWAGIDYIEFIPTSKPAVTPTPAPLTGDVWTVNISWQNEGAVPSGTYADIYNSTIRIQAGNDPTTWKKYDVVHPITASTTSFELVTMAGQSSWTMQGNCLKYENDGGTIMYADCTNYDYENKTVTLRLWANGSVETPTPTVAPTATPVASQTPSPSGDDEWTLVLNGQDHLLLSATNINYHFKNTSLNKEYTITNHESPKKITVPSGTTSSQMKNFVLSSDTDSLVLYDVAVDATNKKVTLSYYINDTASYDPEVTGKNVHLFGDSLCAYNGYITNGTTLLNFPRQGWGKEICNYLDLDNIGVDDLAVAGATSETFKTLHMSSTESYPVAMDWARSRVKSGDYVIINFGVNDGTAIYRQKTMTLQQYKDNLKYYCDFAKDRGATPILVSSPTEFYPVGAITSYTSNHYSQLRTLAAAMQEVATAEGVDYIDLNQTLANDWLLTDGVLDDSKITTNRDLYGLTTTAINTMKTKYSSILGSYSIDEGVSDNLHLNIDGANHVARRITELMKTAKIDFAEYIK